jgi:hypothetical protein
MAFNGHANPDESGFALQIMLVAQSLLFILLLTSTAQQAPPIGIIDYYGLRSVTEQQARQSVGLREGDALPDPWPEFRAKAEGRLKSLPNVTQARLQGVCCDAGKLIIFIGIREKGTPPLRFRSAPLGKVRLPDKIVKAGEAYSDAVTNAVLKGEASEDDSQGHALIANAEARAFQEGFITYAAQNLNLLRAVLRGSADAKHRALAAEIIAYAPNKQDIVKDLVYGTRDADSDVRNNSLRALGVIAKFAQSSSARGIKVPLKPFVELLNSIEWTDRNKSALALFSLTASRDPLVLAYLRRRVLDSLVDMSRWKSPGHAQYPFFILGRVGNIPEDEIQKAWDEGKRESLIERVLQSSKQPAGRRRKS